MIHKLNVITPITGSTPPAEVIIEFDFICEIGCAKVKVDFNDLDKYKRPKAQCSEYIVLGTKYDSSIHLGNDVMYQGAKKIADQVSDLCDCNGWALWRF
jgi:hypothetical protein